MEVRQSWVNRTGEDQAVMPPLRIQKQSMIIVSVMH